MCGQSGTRSVYDVAAAETRAAGLAPPLYRSPLDLVDLCDATAAHEQHSAYQAQLQTERNRHALWEQVVGVSLTGRVDEEHLNTVFKNWRPDGAEVRYPYPPARSTQEGLAPGAGSDWSSSHSLWVQGPDWSRARGLTHHSTSIDKEDVEAQARMACLSRQPRRDGAGLPQGCNRSFIEMLDEREEFNKYRGWAGARETKQRHQDFVPAVRQVCAAPHRPSGLGLNPHPFTLSLSPTQPLSGRFKPHPLVTSACLIPLPPTLEPEPGRLLKRKRLNRRSPQEQNKKQFDAMEDVKRDLRNQAEPALVPTRAPWDNFAYYGRGGARRLAAAAEEEAMRREPCPSLIAAVPFHLLLVMLGLAGFVAYTMAMHGNRCLTCV